MEKTEFIFIIIEFCLIALEMILQIYEIVESKKQSKQINKILKEVRK
jgi:hypothetical protein